jgi:hypothetical protein
MTVTSHPDPDIRTEMRWEGKPAAYGQVMFGAPVAFGDAFSARLYHLVVSDKGVERSALEVFEEAFKDWEQFLGRWGFIEGGCPPPGRPLIGKAHSRGAARG